MYIRIKEIIQKTVAIRIPHFPIFFFQLFCEAFHWTRAGIHTCSNYEMEQEGKYVAYNKDYIRSYILRYMYGKN